MILLNMYIRTSTNGHLSTMATVFVPVCSPYIDSCLNLFAMATSLQQQWHYCVPPAT